VRWLSGVEASICDQVLDELVPVLRLNVTVICSPQAPAMPSREGRPVLVLKHRLPCGVVDQRPPAISRFGAVADFVPGVLFVVALLATRAPAGADPLAARSRAS
jgi:hypothetical protein